MAIVADPRGGSGATGEVHSTKLNDLGAVRMFSDGYEYVYLQGIGSTVAGDLVVYDRGTWTTARLTTSLKGGVAVATAATIASTYGWYGYLGSFSVNNLSATATNVALYPSGTTAVGTSVITKNLQIQGVIARGTPPTTTGGGAQTCQFMSPAWIGAYDESV